MVQSSLFLFIQFSEQRSESEIFENLESHVSPNENIEKHYKYDKVRIGYKKILESFVFEEFVNDKSYNSILKDIHDSRFPEHIYVFLKDFIWKDNSDYQGENYEWIIENWIIDEGKLKEIVYSENQE